MRFRRKLIFFENFIRFDSFILSEFLFIPIDGMFIEKQIIDRKTLFLAQINEFFALSIIRFTSALLNSAIYGTFHLEKKKIEKKIEFWTNSGWRNGNLSNGK